MQPVFTIFLGDNKTMFLKAVDGGDPLDLTYATQVIVFLPNADGTLAQFKLSTGGVIITQPPAIGKFQVPISSVQSALLNLGLLQTFDVTFTIAAQVFSVRYFQSLSVLEVA